MADPTPIKRRRKPRGVGGPNIGVELTFREPLLKELNAVAGASGMARSLYIDLLLQMVRADNGGALPRLDYALDVDPELRMTG